MFYKSNIATFEVLEIQCLLQTRINIDTCATDIITKKGNKTNLL